VGGKARRKEINRRIIRPKWVDNIKMDIREIGWSGMERIHLAQNGEQWRAFLNPATKFRNPGNVWNFLGN
jgi:hypothetical protein